MKLIKWIDYSCTRGIEDHGLGGLGGFFEKGMRWEDYLNAFIPEIRNELETLRKSIIDNHIRCTGSDHQNEKGFVPLWDDNTCDTYSFRAWGDLMAAVWSTEDNTDYSYMDFYC
jgi:hypothetical protein